MNDDEYSALQDERRANNFIVGDGDADGYKDYGGEIWEQEDEFENGPKKKQGGKSIPGFFFNANKDSKSKKKIANSALNQNKASVSNEQSNAVMDKLLKNLDDDNNDEEIGGKYEPEEVDDTGFNIYDQLDQKYDVAVPTLPKAKEPEMEEEKTPDISKTHVEDQVMQEDNYKENDGNHTSNPSERKTSSVVMRTGGDDAEMLAEDEEDSLPQNQSSAINSADKKLGPLPVDSNEALSVFWIDAHEEFNRSKEAYLFGKVHDPVTNDYKSICLKVQGISRIMYVVPKADVTDLTEVHNEISTLFKNRFSYIKQWKSRPITKNYCFETPAKRGKSEYLEIRYSSIYDPLPPGVKGKTFDHIFGRSTSLLELLLVQQKIMGPSWITVKRCKQETSYKQSWCDYEVIVDNPRNIEVTTDDKNKSPPPLKIMTIAMKSFKTARNTKEISMIS
jgi:hypothetical protein